MCVVVLQHFISDMTTIIRREAFYSLAEQNNTIVCLYCWQYVIQDIVWQQIIHKIGHNILISRKV